MNKYDFKKFGILPICLYMIIGGVSRLLFNYDVLNRNILNIIVLALMPTMFAMIIILIVLCKRSAFFQKSVMIAYMFRSPLVSFSALFALATIVIYPHNNASYTPDMSLLSLFWMIFGISITMYVLWFGHFTKHIMQEVIVEDKFEKLSAYNNALTAVYCLALSFILMAYSTISIFNGKIVATNNSLTQQIFELAYMSTIFCCGMMIFFIILPIVKNAVKLTKSYKNDMIDNMSN